MSGDKTLEVGVMPDYPPVVFREGGEVTGLEADFAEQLGEALGRDIVFHEYALADLFAALDAGEIDIIMSGISVTAERQRQYLFSLPYTTIGQMAMIRQADAARFSTPGAITHGPFRIGYKTGTTGEMFVQAHVQGEKRGFASNAQAVQALMEGDVDVFIHDAPTVWNLANQPDQPVKLLGLYRPLTKEQLAWVMRRDNGALKADVDTVLKNWMNDGTLNRIKNRWMPVKILAGE
ncbi:MAG: transporter substrate-binding domain-containing protein [Pseudomonadales bacterium]|nr:transporter substrate-binding domain-containing protein [Pseudomonadales bacterium]